MAAATNNGKRSVTRSVTSATVRCRPPDVHASRAASEHGRSTSARAAPVASAWRRPVARSSGTQRSSRRRPRCPPLRALRPPYPHRRRWRRASGPSTVAPALRRRRSPAVRCGQRPEARGGEIVGAALAPVTRSVPSSGMPRRSASIGAASASSSTAPPSAYAHGVPLHARAPAPPPHPPAVAPRCAPAPLNPIRLIHGPAEATNAGTARSRPAP